MCGGGRGGRGGSIGRQWVMGAVFGVGGMSGDCVGVGHRVIENGVVAVSAVTPLLPGLAGLRGLVGSLYSR